jgi:hypothetical protein
MLLQSSILIYWKTPYLYNLWPWGACTSLGTIFDFFSRTVWFWVCLRTQNCRTASSGYLRRKYQNQRTGGSRWFRNLKEPSGSMEELMVFWEVIWLVRKKNENHSSLSDQGNWLLDNRVYISKPSIWVCLENCDLSTLRTALTPGGGWCRLAT